MFRAIAITVAGAAILVVAGTLLIPVAKGKKVRMNTKDLPEHRVRLISPGHSAYQGEIEREKEGKSSEQQNAIEALRPFSVFVDNQNNQSVVAYSLKWEMTREDGQTVTYFASYSNADALSGGDPLVGPVIPPGSKTFVALAPQAAQDTGIGTGPNLRSASEPTIGSTAVEALLGQLQQSADVTVTIDSAVFADGKLVGPDSQRHFERLRALVGARNDLLRGALNSVRHGNKLDDVMNKIKTISEADVDLSKGGESALYMFYRKEFASEIIRMKTATGDDKTTFWYAFQPLTKKWPKLSKEK